MALIQSLFVIMIAGVPVIPLSPHSVSSALCTDSASTTTVKVGDTGTTYDAVFYTHTQTVPKVPLWWYGVMAVSEGITTVLRHTVGCVPDVRGMITQVNLTRITDPHLRQEAPQIKYNILIFKEILTRR